MDESGYGGYTGGMDLGGGCMPMDNIAYISGSEVLGNQIPSGNVEEAPADVSYINEGNDLDLDLDIKMPKMKFKKPKPTPVVRRNYSSNNGGTISLVVGVLVGIAIFLILYFFVISD
ncbi:uncharacterized protein LOC123559403 [Mercenaria mercenaria]|uniref:uncharacterized protein LOC123559403 n=1 Tax=Mercenaria mercenaria TaxID=6596 RepID=UPI001E1DC783|nr:uncharacterized protein LOC123559403 [Mercenaria mercenaria]